MKALIGIAVLLIYVNSFAQSDKSAVVITGAMKNVMWQGELKGKIFLDTITDKRHLYGMGPSENLNAELLIMDGRSFRSSVLTDSTMKVEETYQSKAPFFAYAHVEHWKEEKLPGNVRSLRQLEAYLDETMKDRVRPFFFRLEGIVPSAVIHIVNLPPGTKVKSPQDAHKGRTFYNLRNERVEVLGFYSTFHQSVFTHHDTHLHLHILSSDKQKMGHLDELLIDPEHIRFFMPADQ